MVEWDRCSPVVDPSLAATRYLEEKRRGLAAHELADHGFPITRTVPKYLTNRSGSIRSTALVSSVVVIGPRRV